MKVQDTIQDTIIEIEESLSPYTVGTLRAKLGDQSLEEYIKVRVPELSHIVDGEYYVFDKTET